MRLVDASCEGAMDMWQGYIGATAQSAPFPRALGAFNWARLECSELSSQAQAARYIEVVPGD
jgi:hypothetical protein